MRQMMWVQPLLRVGKAFSLVKMQFEVRRSAFFRRPWTLACLVALFCAAAAIASPAQDLTTLANFAGSNGGNPQASLIQGTDGNLWGTTEYGGATYVGGVDWGNGDVFKISPSGDLSVVYSFCSQANCADGSYPADALVQASDGNFYGTTYSGGANNGGTVFKLTPEGELTTIYSLPYGSNATAGLVQASNGYLYGATNSSIFKISTEGKFTTVYEFGSGVLPNTLIEVSSGDFYGTTYGGGAHGLGSVFKMTAGGKLTTLYSFCPNRGSGPCTDGEYPSASLVEGGDGNLYGTTAYGGTSEDCGAGCGTIFKITPKGAFTSLVSFANNGSTLTAPLIQANDGNFYGTASKGDGNSEPCVAGCVFEMTPAGSLGDLFSFDNIAYGLEPIGGLIQDTNGNFYGTTADGGSYGEGADSGTVFELATGLKPFVTTSSAFGKIGAKVTILGTDLTGATSVTFNGAAASFTVVSASEITTTVPSSATTGTVKVATPSGALASNPAFQVIGLILTKTTTTLSSSPNPSAYNEPVTFTATVSSSKGAPPDGETVSFIKGSTTLGTGTLSGGSAGFTTSALKVGTSSIKAVYSGDSNFDSSTSAPLSQVVDKANTTTTLASSLNPSKVGQSVTFTATVTAQFGGTVTGKVTFEDNGSVLKTVTLSGGTAAYTTSKLTEGTHTMTATSTGGASFEDSSASLTQTVN